MAPRGKAVTDRGPHRLGGRDVGGLPDAAPGGPDVDGVAVRVHRERGDAAGDVAALAGVGDVARHGAGGVVQQGPGAGRRPVARALAPLDRCDVGGAAAVGLLRRDGRAGEGAVGVRLLLRTEGDLPAPVHLLHDGCQRLRVPVQAGVLGGELVQALGAALAVQPLPDALGAAERGGACGHGDHPGGDRRGQRPASAPGGGGSSW